MAGASGQGRLELDLFQRPELIQEILEIGAVVGKADAEIIAEIGGHQLSPRRRAEKRDNPGSRIDAVTRGTLTYAVEINSRDRVRRGDRLGKAVHRAHQLE